MYYVILPPAENFSFMSEENSKRFGDIINNPVRMQLQREFVGQHDGQHDELPHANSSYNSQHVFPASSCTNRTKLAHIATVKCVDANLHSALQAVGNVISTELRI